MASKVGNLCLETSTFSHVNRRALKVPTPSLGCSPFIRLRTGTAVSPSTMAFFRWIWPVSGTLASCIACLAQSLCFLMQHSSLILYADSLTISHHHHYFQWNHT